MFVNTVQVWTNKPEYYLYSVIIFALEMKISCQLGRLAVQMLIDMNVCYH